MMNSYGKFPCCVLDVPGFYELTYDTVFVCQLLNIEYKLQPSLRNLKEKKGRSRYFHLINLRTRCRSLKSTQMV